MPKFVIRDQEARDEVEFFLEIDPDGVALKVRHLTHDKDDPDGWYICSIERCGTLKVHTALPDYLGLDISEDGRIKVSQPKSTALGVLTGP